MHIKANGKSALSTVLVLLLALSLLLTACGRKPEPDPGQDEDVSIGTGVDENPVEPDDSTDASVDESADESTDESTDESADASADTSDDTTSAVDQTVTEDTKATTKGEGKVTTKTTTKGEGKVTTKTTTKGEGKVTTKATTKGEGKVTTKATTKGEGKVTTKTTTKGEGKVTTKTTTKSTTKTTNPILNPTTQTKTTTKTTTKSDVSVTTSHVMDKGVKEQILDMFDPSMKGKTVSVLSGWDQGTDEKAKMDELIAATGIKVKWIVAVGDNYATRLSALINAQASPDLAMINSSGYPSMVIKNFFQDLSVTGVDTTSELFDQQLMKAFTWNGKQYGLVLKNSEYSGLYFTFYNKAIFSKLGVTDPGTLWKQGNWNWDTFLDCAQKTADVAQNRLGVDFYGSESFLMTSGLPIVSVGDGNITNNLEDPRIVEAWTLINKLHHEYKVTAATVDCHKIFAAGNTAMLLGDSWLANAGDIICSQMTDAWSIVPLPMKKGVENMTPITPCGGAIPIGAKNPKMGAGVWAYWCSYDTGMLGSGKPEGTTGAYSRDEINDVKRALWELDKIPNMSQGVLEYGGEYSHWDLGYEIWYGGMSGIQSSIGKWKGALDVNIKRIMTEFS